MSSEQQLILASCCLSPMRRNLVFEVLRVKRLAVIQEDIACRAFWRWSNAGIKVRWEEGEKKLSIVGREVMV